MSAPAFFALVGAVLVLAISSGSGIVSGSLARKLANEIETVVGRPSAYGRAAAFRMPQRETTKGAQSGWLAVAPSGRVFEVVR